MKQTVTMDLEVEDCRVLRAALDFVYDHGGFHSSVENARAKRLREAIDGRLAVLEQHRGRGRAG